MKTFLYLFMYGHVVFGFVLLYLIHVNKVKYSNSREILAIGCITLGVFGIVYDLLLSL